jgi:hypothetical protein
MINSLKENQIFVFGSNLAGEHLGGAAKQAYEEFGAEWGFGEGLTGRSYAFPTLTEDFKHLSHEELLDSVHKLYEIAQNNPDKEFLLTKVGEGIAGYAPEYMKGLFRDLPDNIKRV